MAKTFIPEGYPKVEFTNDVKVFLEEYSPKDRHFTSYDEIELITEKLELKGKLYSEIQAIRNSVVEYYSILEEKEIEEFNNRTDNWWKYITAMQSVTTAIDHYRYTNCGTI